MLDGEVGKDVEEEGGDQGEVWVEVGDKDVLVVIVFLLVRLIMVVF